MKTHTNKFHYHSIAFAVLGLVAASPSAWSDDEETEIPFDVASLYFELNDTDGDLGIHSLIDGEPWKKLEIEDPYEREMLNIKVQGRLKRQGLTELFFESAEPTFDELTPEQFFHRFPEGTYEIEGKTLEGEELESTAELSHVLPAPAGNILVSGIPASDDCDVTVPVVTTPVTISWDPVTTSHPELGRADIVEVDKYQLVVEREEPTLLIYSVDLPPTVTSFPVPESFTDLGDEFKYEILVRATTGNQTATESCFEVE